jgi:hypothetical protein
MIAIKINNEYLDLPETFAVSMQQQSPLFKETATATGYSYPIEIPLTPKNRQILGYLDQLDIAKDFDTYPCTISFGGAELILGTLNINSIDQKKASAYIIEYNFDSKRLDTNIRDIPLGGVRSIVPTMYAEMYEHANALVHSDADSSDYVFFPTHNNRFFEGHEVMNNTLHTAPHTYSHVINLWDFQKQSYFDAVRYLQMGFDYAFDVYIDVDETVKQSTYVPYPYVVAILRYIARYLGEYKLVGDWVNDAYIKKLCIYNTHSLDNVSSFTTMLGTFPQIKSDADIDLKNHLPDVSIKTFISEIANLFNLAVTIDNKNKQLKITSKNNILNSAEIYTYQHEPIITITPPEKNIVSVSLEMAIDEQDTYQDSKKLLVIDAKVLPDANAFSVGDTVGAIRFSPASYVGKVNGSYRPSIVPNAPKFLLDTGLMERRAEIGTLETLKNINIDYAYYDNSSASTPATYLSGIIPIAQQIGNSSIYGVQEDYLFRLMFYAGMNPDPNGYGVYPIGTNDIYDDNGNVIGDYSLKWRGGPHALYEAWWQKWLTVYTGKKITVPLILSIAEILALDLTKKIRIANKLYLIADISYTLSNNGISNVKANCIQIP